MLNQTNNTGSAIYTVNPLFISESIPINIYYNAPGYTINNNNQAFVLNTINLQNTLTKLPAITITPQNKTLNQGTTQQFTATVDQNGTTVDVTNLVTWSSSNAAVATINSSGLATGISDGSTTISTIPGSVSQSTMFNFVGNLYVGNANLNSTHYFSLTESGVKLNESVASNLYGRMVSYKNYIFILHNGSSMYSCLWDAVNGIFNNPSYIGSVSMQDQLAINDTGYIYYMKYSSTNGGNNLFYSIIYGNGTIGTARENSSYLFSANNIYIFNKYLYLGTVISNRSDFYYCSLNSDNFTYSNCQYTGLAYNGYGINSMTIYNGYAYLARTNNGNALLDYCKVNSDGSLTNCVNYLNYNASTIPAVIVKKNKLYFAKSGYGILYCSINSTNGSLSNCSDFIVNSNYYNTFFY
jgi:hypothetical protein